MGRGVGVEGFEKGLLFDGVRQCLCKKTPARPFVGEGSWMVLVCVCVLSELVGDYDSATIIHTGMLPPDSPSISSRMLLSRSRDCWELSV